MKGEGRGKGKGERGEAPNIRLIQTELSGSCSKLIAIVPCVLPSGIGAVADFAPGYD
jgi:hypothetical protein